MLSSIIFNKPKGCVSARRDERHKTVMDYFPEEYREKYFIIGRLDKDTEGLLILTEDGKLSHKLTSPESKIEKTYFFWAHGIPDENKLRELENGVKIYKNRDSLTEKAEIKLCETRTLKEIIHLISTDSAKLMNKYKDTPVVSGIIKITEGKKHQVKRMIRYTGAKVVYLERVAIGSLKLDSSLKRGDYRPLTEEELKLLISV